MMSYSLFGASLEKTKQKKHFCACGQVFHASL